MKAKKIYFVLLAFFALAFAGCKAKNNSPIAACVVDTSVNPIAVFSDADGNERTDCEILVPTKLRVIEQKGNLLNVKFSDGKPKKSGWVQLEDVSLNAEIFDKTVNLALDGDENAQMLFEHGFPRFTNEEAIARLSPILERIGARLQNADRSEENDKRIFLVLKEFIDAKCKPNETNPLHLLTPYANEEILDWFDQNDMDVPDSDGRTCLMIAVKNENLKAVNYFYKHYKHTNYSELDHKDNEGRTIVDYIDSCKNTEIKEILALCRYNVENLIFQCTEYLEQTQAEREYNELPLSEDSSLVLLTQKEFRSEAEAIVVRESEMFLPDGTKTQLKANDTVEIIELLSDKGKIQPYNSLFEYELPSEGERFFSRYNFYLARFKDKIGIVGGKALAHEKLGASVHFGKPAETDTIKLYVSYKYVKSVYGNEKTYYADLYEQDLKSGKMRKLETGRTEYSAPFDFVKAPVYLGGQDFMCNFSLVQFDRFDINGTAFYLCSLSFNPYLDDENRPLYHFYAVRDDGTAFLLGTFGNSEYVRNCAEVSSNFFYEPDENTKLPAMTIYEYGYKARNWATGEKEEPFTVIQKLKLDTESMKFVETSLGFSDSVPEF